MSKKPPLIGGFFVPSVMLNMRNINKDMIYMSFNKAWDRLYQRKGRIHRSLFRRLNILVAQHKAAWSTTLKQKEQEAGIMSTPTPSSAK